MRTSRATHSVFPFLLVLLGATAACGGGTGPEAAPLRLEARPAEEQRRVIEEEPGSFGWLAFNGSIRVSAQGAAGWEGRLLMRTLQLEAGGIVERSTARSVTVTGEELAEGQSVTDLLATPRWPPSRIWIPLDDWRPVTVWTPGRALDGSVTAVMEAASAAVGEGQTVLVVWAMPAAGTAEGRKVTSRPFAVILERVS